MPMIRYASDDYADIIAMILPLFLLLLSLALLNASHAWRYATSYSL